MENILFSKNFFHHCNYLVLFLLLNIIKFTLSFENTQFETRFLLNYDSEIRLIIQGYGNQSLINKEFNIEPYEVIVNGASKGNSCKKICKLENILNNVTLKFNQSINSCANMFKDLINIKEIDLSKFDFSKVINMSSMFYNCSNLGNIIFGNISISSVVNIKSLPQNRKKLESLDLSGFDTSLVIDMSSMFYHCYKIGSIIFSKLFNTSNVGSMKYMFSNCRNLYSLDLSSFDTSKVNEMSYMFSNCSNLRFLNLSNFSSKNLKDIKEMFEGCTSLLYLDLSSFAINKSINGDLRNITSKICIQDNYTKNFLLGQKRVSICSDTCYNESNIKIDPNNSLCIYSCEEIKKNYEYFNTCYSQCPEDTYVKANENNECFDRTPKGYYLDKNESKFKECYNNCTDCSECNNEIISIKDNISNDETYLEIDTQNITLDIINITMDETQKEIIRQNLSSLLNMLINEVNFTELNEGHDVRINNDGDQRLIYTITTTSNQNKNYKNKNLTTINLGECEVKLKEKYNISLNDSLYIFKIDVYLDNMKIPKIEYEVFFPINDNIFTKLNLSICKNININISIPVDLPLNQIDEYNASSGLYNDLCYTLTTEKGTDKILKDRQNDFIKNNMTVCEENCEFIYYDTELNKTTCSCSVKEEIPLLSEIKINTKIFFSNFMNTNNFANFKLIKCNHLLFNMKDIFNNSANYLMLRIITLSIITIFIFALHDYLHIN